MCGSGNAGYARHLLLFFLVSPCTSPGGDVRAPLRDGREHTIDSMTAWALSKAWHHLRKPLIRLAAFVIRTLRTMPQFRPSAVVQLNREHGGPPERR
jgi:hypothetical protein